MKKTALIMAMKEEADPVIKEFGMKRFSPEGNRVWNSPVYRSEKYPELFLVLNGSYVNREGISKVGTTAATQALFVALEQLDAEHIVNAGTAGGFDARSTVVGDVFVATKAFYHDRRVPINDAWTEFAEGAYDLYFKEEWFEKYDFKKGFVSTGNSLDYVERDLEILHKNGAHIKEMEAAAIAEICMEQKVPFTAIKSITDIVDGDRPTQEEFLENLHLAATSLASHLLKFLKTEILES